MMLGNIRFRDFWLGTIAWSSMELFLREVMGAEAFGAMLAEKWFPSPIYLIFVILNLTTIIYVAAKKEKINV